MEADAKRLNEFTVKAGKRVTIKLSNTSKVANVNFVLCAPGKGSDVLLAVGAQANDFGKAAENGWLPESKHILHHTKLLRPGETDEIAFIVEAGAYHFLSTWSTFALLGMKGIMKAE